MSSLFKRLAVALLAAILVVSLAGCIETAPTKENGGTGSQANQSKETIFSLNETAVFSTLKITATEIKESTGDTFLPPEEGNVFLGVKFAIENISNEEQTISSLLLFDAYVDDVSCDISFTAGAAFDGETVDGTVAPGKKLVGWYTVEVPQEWQELELQVKANWLSDSTAKFVFAK